MLNSMVCSTEVSKVIGVPPKKMMVYGKWKKQNLYKMDENWGYLYLRKPSTDVF